MAMTPYRSPTDLFPAILEDLLRPGAGWAGRMEGMLRAPHADVVESADAIRVMIELAGIDPKDIELDLENNILTISGQKNEERRDENDTWHLSERRYGKFSRSFMLPRDVEEEKIQAHYDGGVLTVTIPKSGKSRKRRIEVQGGAGQKEIGGPGARS
jgi:HSP20 family protein